MRHTLRRTLTYVTVLLLHGFMAEIPEAYVFDALRTPRGRGKASGSLYEVKPVSLVVGLIDEMRARHPELDTDQIDDVVLGVVSPIGDQGGDIAKTAAIAAGLPRHRRGRAAQPLLRLRARSRQHGRAQGPLGHGGAGARGRGRGDVARADGLRRRRVGHGPRHLLHHRLRPPGHRRRPHRHPGGLHARGRRHVRRRVADPRGEGVGQRLLREVRRAGEGPQRPADPRPRRAHPRGRHPGEPRRACSRRSR